MQRQFPGRMLENRRIEAAPLLPFPPFSGTMTAITVPVTVVDSAVDRTACCGLCCSLSMLVHILPSLTQQGERSAGCTVPDFLQRQWVIPSFLHSDPTSPVLAIRFTQTNRSVRTVCHRAFFQRFLSQLGSFLSKLRMGIDGFRSPLAQTIERQQCRSSGKH